jgi:CheY-like chemotaxis protein
MNLGTVAMLRLLQICLPDSRLAIDGAPWAAALADPRNPQLSVDTAQDLATARQLLAGADHVAELIVLWQDRPGQFIAEELEALRCAAPLARMWRVIGPWCEGESRSGRPPAGCLSVPWHEWPARLQRELQAMLDGCAPEWRLPVTASVEERTLAFAERAPDRGAGAVAIASRQASTAVALADLLRSAGYEPLLAASRASSAQRCDAARAILWDTCAEAMCNGEKVAAVRAIAPGAALLALATFPRPADVARATELGVKCIVAKPFLAVHLTWVLARCLRAAA